MDVLAALEALEKEEQNQKKGKGKVKQKPQQRGRSTTPTQRPRSLPPPRGDIKDPNLLSPIPPTSPSPSPSTYTSERSPSIGAESARRISFADAPRPSVRRLRIPTKGDHLSSGFPFDSRLAKYHVSEEEWNHFSREVVEQTTVTSSWAGPFTWIVHKKDVEKKIKKQLQYETSDLKRLLKKWNRLFKRQGFQAHLEPPTNKVEKETTGGAAVETAEEKEQAKREAKRWRIVITPDAEKGSSVYSRTSSLTRSVSREFANVKLGENKGDDVDFKSNAVEVAALSRASTRTSEPSLSPPPLSVTRSNERGPTWDDMKIFED
jgi:hypothetical protein